MVQTKERAPLEAATSKSAKTEHIREKNTTKQARLQGPKYPNLLAVSQGGGASICTMAGWINATEEVFFKIIWGKEELYTDEAIALSRYLKSLPITNSYTSRSPSKRVCRVSIVDPLKWRTSVSTVAFVVLIAASMSRCVAS